MKKAVKTFLNFFAWLWSLICGNPLRRLSVYLSCRAETYRFQRSLGSHGKGLSVMRFNRFEGLKKVRIGNNFTSQDGLWLAANLKYKEFKYDPAIILGDDVHLSRNVHISAIERIEVEDNVLIGSNVLINDHNHGSPNDFSSPRHLLPLQKTGSIFIGANTWVCDNCVILGGTSIGKNCVVAANSVVKGKFPEGSLIAGCPARIVKRYFEEETK